MDVSEAVRKTEDGAEIDIIVSPRSGKSGSKGVDEWRKRLAICVKAPPLEGRANREVEETFSKVTGCKCAVVRGQTSRQKTVAIYGDYGDILESLREMS